MSSFDSLQRNGFAAGHPLGVVLLAILASWMVAGCDSRSSPTPTPTPSKEVVVIDSAPSPSGLVAPNPTVTSGPPAPLFERTGRYALQVPTGIVCVEDDGYVWAVREGKIASSGHAADCGGYSKTVKFWINLKRAVLGKDFSSLGRLVDYPLRVNTDGGTFYIRDVADLERRFYHVFPKAALQRVRNLDPYIVWCNWSGGRLSKGYLWSSAKREDDGRLKLYAVNRDMYLNPVAQDDWLNPTNEAHRVDVLVCPDRPELR